MTDLTEPAVTPEEPTFTREQISDPTFYKANRAEILRAANAGRITGKSRGRS